MKRISMLAMSVGLALFAAGCGQAHHEGEARHDAPTSHEAAADLHNASHDAEHAAHDLNHAANAARADAAADAHEAAAEYRGDLHAQPEVIQVRGDVEVGHPASQAQLRQEVKTDAVDAAAAAAAAEAEKVFKIR